MGEVKTFINQDSIPMEYVTERVKISTLSLDAFKQALDRDGFVSPLFSSLMPSENLHRTSNGKEVFGFILAGDLTLITSNDKRIHLTNEVFFIDPHMDFEIRAGNKGVEFLFAFKGQA